MDRSITSTRVPLLPYAPNALPTSISDYVKLAPPTGLGYVNLFASDANLTVTPAGPGYTGNTAGLILTVTVTADKHWWLLGSRQLMCHIQLPGFPNPQTFTATTAMGLER